MVTTLFCDLVGFTAISECNDPELVDAMLRRYYAAVRRVIESYGGVVEKFIGDAVVAVFGVPALHEDDPERAVRAGLRLVDEIDALPGIAGQAVEVRVGINTGEALVRLDVDPASGEGFLTGDAVNVAARLQSAAPPMAVAVGEATHSATEKVFAFDVCHPVALKGKSQPLRAWIATAPKVRTGADLRSFATSFVGRDEELGALEGLLRHAAGDDRAQLALIVGEPGIGKSRLVAELARRVDDGPLAVTWRQGRCLPFGANVTFWALSEIVRSCAGVLESDGVARTEARLEAVLPASADRDLLRARLRPLLGLEAEEASREENFAAWRAFLEVQAAQGPTVLVVEDLHWADEPMLAFLDDLAQGLGEAPLLVLATGRQEVLEFAGPGEGFVSMAHQVPLGPLSGDETSRLILARLGAKSLPVSLQAALLERSGGNPLFAEELVRLLADRDLLESHAGSVALKPGAELPMPESIGALIAARLDLLTRDRKALIADAAVVGRSFWAGAVAAVGEQDPADVLLGLHELVAKELVRPERASSMEGEAEFSFVHALVCDVAYSQLTLADRAAKHAALARWLEGRTAGRTEDLAEVLAYHYGTALELATSCGLDLEDELMEPTSRYLALAGGRAAPLDATAAAAHFARAERVTAEAQRPRRWLLSRRTRRTLRRRAPLLVGAVALVAVAAVAAVGIWAFAPDKAPTDAARTMSADQIATAYGSSVVRITTPPMPPAATGKETPSPIVGSGFMVTKNGVIVTSLGTVQGRGLNAPATVTVEYVLPSGQYGKATGRVLYDDEGGGLAFIKVDPRKVALKPLPFADSESIHEGLGIVVLGAQNGMYIMRAAGKVTGLEDNVEDGNWGNRGIGGFYYDADYPKPANPEPLTVIGGPVFDTTGHVVGLVGQLAFGVHSYSSIWGYDGDVTHEATAINLVKLTVTGVTSNPAPLAGHTAYLGVGGQWMTSKVAQELGEHAGDLVEEVTVGSPADRAGIRSGTTSATTDGVTYYRIGGDVVVSVDGVQLTPQVHMGNVIGRLEPGDVVPIRLWRDDKLITITVKLGKVP